MPLLGAYVADTRWGRFKTICVAVGIALLGHAVLVVAGLPRILEHTSTALTYFLVALVIMGVGTGGFKSNISPLVAEQYTKTKMTVATAAHGERVIIDPAMTTARIYMVGLSAQTFSSLLMMTRSTSIYSSISGHCSDRFS